MSDFPVMTLAEALPLEQARVRRILGYYKEIGPAGAIGARLIFQSLGRAEQAVSCGDVIAMLAAYHDLKSIKE